MLDTGDKYVSKDTGSAGGPRPDTGAGRRGGRCFPADIRLLRKRAANATATGIMPAGGFLSC